MEKQGLQKVQRATRALGTQVVITAYHKDQRVALSAIDSAFRELERVEAVMSLYRPDSQLSLLNERGILPDPDPYLVQVLEFAGRLSKESGGAFDTTVQPLWSLYNEAASRNALPGKGDLESVLAEVDWRRVQLSREGILLEGSGTKVTLNGIAQGFAADAVSRALRLAGVENALVDAGEIETIGRPPLREDWTIGIKHPREKGNLMGVVDFQGRCLATSGDYEMRFSENFVHNHILDPRTGLSPTELSSVSVLAPTAMQADALSTCLFVLGVEKGRELVEKWPGVDALFITKQGSLSQTAGFPTLEKLS